MPRTEPDRQPVEPGARVGSGPSWIVIAVLLVAAVVALAVFAPRSSTTPTLPYSTFLADVGAGKVKSVEIDQTTGHITGSLSDSTLFETQGPPGALPDTDLAALDAHHVARTYSASSSTSGSKVWTTLLAWLLPMALLGLAAYWLLGRGRRSQLAGMGEWGKSRARVHDAERPPTTFTDVAGYGPVKEELSELVGFLTNPDRFSGIGARIPKGIMLVGPPGTGKTLLARAVAGEARVPFISVTGSEFMEMFVGVGAARVRDLFKTARQSKPAIVFVDEIDAIGRKRGAGVGGGHDEREQTLNQLLAEMDGFEATEGIVMMAATNRPDILDPALLRAGRFDRQVIVPLPSLEERIAILVVHGRTKRLGPDVDFALVARGTPGMSGADLGNLVNEAALIAVRRGAAEVTQADLEAARDRIMMGLQRTALVLSPEEKRLVAYHEAGHAVLAELLPNTDPVHRVTILPTGMALGATQQLPLAERQLHQRPYIEDALAVRLGGRAAEELVFGTPSTGAQDDLTSATELAARMVREWGMSAELGPIAWGPRGPVFLGEELVQGREYSDETARVIDRETARILTEQQERAGRLLGANRDALDAVATTLATEETLDGDRVRQLMRGDTAPDDLAGVSTNGRHPT